MLPILLRYPFAAGVFPGSLSTTGYGAEGDAPRPVPGGWLRGSLVRDAAAMQTVAAEAG